MIKIANIALLVRDYDEAIDFYVNQVGFELTEDTKLSDTKRWVRVRPCDGTCSLLLAKATTAEQVAQIGNQSGGRVFLFLHTDDFQRDYEAMKSRGVKFIEEPRNEPYGRVAVFEDLYGNKWDLVEPTSASLHAPPA